MSVIHRVVFPSRLSDIHIHKTTSSIHVYKVSLIEAHAKSILYTNKYKSGLKRHCWVQSNIYWSRTRDGSSSVDRLGLGVLTYVNNGQNRIANCMQCVCSLRKFLVICQNMDSHIWPFILILFIFHEDIVSEKCLLTRCTQPVISITFWHGKLCWKM